MNIKQAKKQIESATRAYLAKDARGVYRIPQNMQRPMVVFGPPGVGKTAVVSQVADELGINFVSYSITHHTRQSALGLPFISTEVFDGREYHVADYTMSEIIAAVHRVRKETGVDEGILFLDEVNCVSETLAPAMLQFLQFKTFGMHRLPDGWVIVCAGNPPEYNRAAREFDPALLDRIKRIDVDANLEVWQEYAVSHGIHPAVTTFLDAKPASFYIVRAGVSAPRLVTARGWEDLSRILQTYEAEGLTADVDLVRQYLQDDQVSHEFYSYYDLFRKYQDDYKVSQILDGEADGNLVERASDAPFDERLAVVGLLLDAVLSRIHGAAVRKEALGMVRSDLQSARASMNDDDFQSSFARRLERVQVQFDHELLRPGVLDDHDAVKVDRLCMLQQMADSLNAGFDTSFDAAKSAFNSLVDGYEAQVKQSMDSVDHVFGFLDAAFGEKSQEALIMVTKLSADPTMVDAVAEHGSGSFLKHNKDLLLSERGNDLARQIRTLEGID
ncbi:MAG: AAA family ATPase [Eggerthellaceae bacterium]|nr:AAA family ATPase [Eggerthellaceae bacterium]